MKEEELKAKRHKVNLILPTKAIQILQAEPEDSNAILHVTCFDV